MKYDVEQYKREIERLIKTTFPITAGKRSFELESVNFIEPDRLGSSQYEYELKLNKRDLVGKVEATFVLKEDGQIIDRSTITMADVPYLTKRNTFLVGGNESVILDVQKLRRGTYTSAPKEYTATTDVISSGKRKISITYDAQRGFLCSIGGRSVSLYALLGILGVTEREFSDAIKNAPDVSGLVSKMNSVSNRDIESLFEKVTPTWRQKDGKTLKDKTEILQEYFTNNKFDNDERKVNEITLGVKDGGITKNFLLTAIKKTIDTALPWTSQTPDNKDDLRFQEILTATDQFIEQFKEGLGRVTQVVTRNLGLRGKDTVRKVWGTLRPSDNVMKFLKMGDTKNLPETLNPLELLSTQRRISLTGELTGLSRENVPKKVRNLQTTDIGRIDLVESPEQKIGLIKHLARDADIKNRTITTKYIVMKNGSGSIRKTTELTPLEEYDKYVAFYDLDKVKKSENNIQLTGKVRARYMGQIVEVDANKIQYMDLSPHSQFGYIANLVPFAAHNDANRMLMSAAQQKQAINLVNREKPLVLNAVSEAKKKTYEEEIAEKAGFILKAPVNGVVKEIADNKIVLTGVDGKSYEIEKYNYFPLNQDGYIHHELKVKEGDTVKAGQLLADGWQTKDGVLAIGVNARVGFMPYEGYNFEDGIVVTRSFAERMASEEVKMVEVSIKKGENWAGGKGSNIKKRLLALGISQDKLSKVDDDGIIKAGTEIVPGDLLVGRIKLKEKPSKAKQIFTFLYDEEDKVEDVDASQYVEGYLRGKVIRVEQMPASDADEIIRVTVVAKKPLQVGDKLAGRHGNKGEVTLILEDDEALIAEDGKPLEVILSPLGVPSRKNLGQILETNAGLIAEKVREPYKVFNFDKNERKKVLEKLKEIGYKGGKMRVTNPATGKPFENKVTVGNMYMLKLLHKVDEKIQARSYGTVENIYNMPVKRSGKLAGTKDNPMSLSEMDIRALQSHGAVQNILESTTLKSDGVRDRIELYTALQTGTDLPAHISPASLKVLEDKLKAAAVRMAPIRGGKETTLDDKFNKLMLRPVSDKEIEAWAVGEVTRGTSVYQLGKESKGNKIEKGGLMDPAVFKTDIEDPIERSKAERTNWAYISLPEPMPHPLFMDGTLNPYAILTGLKNADVNKIMKENVGVIIESGDTGLNKGTILSISEIKKLQEQGKKMTVEYGGRALEALLKEIDIDKKINEVKGQLKQATAEKEMNQLYRILRVLENLKQNNLQPTDLLYRKVPVMPIALRPIVKHDEGMAIDDVNYLYIDLLKAANTQKPSTERMEAGYEPEENYVKNINNLYSQFEKLFTKGTGDVGAKTKKSIFETFKGKAGLIRGKLLSKRVDYSGRSVIINNPKLKLNEIGLPIDIATEVYKPFFIKKLRDTGVAKSYIEAENICKQRTPEVLDTLRKTVEERPVILNRAPTLHKHSMLAFNPILTENKSIELNSVITTPFNADFDGDAMQVFVPLSQKAVDEAKELLMPSKNLISPTGGKIIMELKHEMVLGLWYMTKTRKMDESKAKEYTNAEKLRADYWNDEIRTYDPVKMDGKIGTAGQHLFASYLPASVRKKYFRKEMTNKILGQLIAEVLEKEGAGIATKLIDDLKELGFKASTKSSLSLGLEDFINDEKFKKKLISDTEKKVAERIIAEAEKKVEEAPDKAIASLMDIDEAAEMVRAKEYMEAEKKMEKVLMEKLPSDNPLKAMAVSGARAKADQVRKMAGMVGVGMDITGKITPFPITSSHLEGLSPSEYFVHALDSRRGMADRALETAKPGELTRKLYYSMQHQVISMKDCKDKQGVPYSVNDRSIIGRVFAKGLSIPGKKRIKAGEMCTKEIYEELRKNATEIPSVNMRSPLTCKAPQGICSMCYGSKPGEEEFYSLGAPIGSIASQAIGEPTAQGTMNVFHTGNVEGVTSGFDTLATIFSIPFEGKGTAVLTEKAGVVLDVDNKGLFRYVKVDGKKYSIPPGRKILPHIVVGYQVSALEPLTDGYKSPREILETSGLDTARKEYATEIRKTVETILSPGTVDPRHLELAATTLSSKALVTDPGNTNVFKQEFFPTKGLQKGQYMDKNILDIWNQKAETPIAVNTLLQDELVGAVAAETVKDKKQGIIVQEGQKITEDMTRALRTAKRSIKIYPKKIEYKPKVFGAGQTFIGKMENNWLTRTAYGFIEKNIQEGTLTGQADPLDQPISRMMTGKLMNVGAGFRDWLKEKTKNFSEGIAALFQ